MNELRNLVWCSSYLMVVGLFSAMAFVLVVPTGGASASVLLVCSFLYLTFHRSGSFPANNLNTHERWFLASMTLYPVSVALNFLWNEQSFAWNYLDNPTRFLLALFVYYAIRKSGISPVALVTGSIVGAAGAGVLGIFQWTVLETPRPGGFVNPIPFADIALLLVFIALTPISLPKTVAPATTGRNSTGRCRSHTCPDARCMASDPISGLAGRWSGFRVAGPTSSSVGCCRSQLEDH